MKNPPFELSSVQKKHVTLLYHFASLEYLKELQQKVHALMRFIDPTLDLAKLQGRDAVLTDARWGTRNTSQNFSNTGWQFLADFELSIARQIAQRSYESYSITGANQCSRGLEEISLAWMTPDEQETFESALEKISHQAMFIDDTMNLHEQSGRWDDFSLTMASSEFADIFKSAPALRLRPDVIVTTNGVPVRTGVYLPMDDPNGSPQFCWVGKPAGMLLECNTLNPLGLEALADVGRGDLWVNDRRMHEFVQARLTDPRLTQDPLFEDSAADPDLASSLVARNAFTSRYCTWIYVEQIHAAVESFDENESYRVVTAGRRVAAGTACPQTGYYFTPAQSGPRRLFAKGEIMPEAGGDYGATIWQWDAKQ